MWENHNIGTNYSTKMFWCFKFGEKRTIHCKPALRKITQGKRNIGSLQTLPTKLFLKSQSLPITHRFSTKLEIHPIPIYSHEFILHPKVDRAVSLDSFALLTSNYSIDRQKIWLLLKKIHSLPTVVCQKLKITEITFVLFQSYENLQHTLV